MSPQGGAIGSCTNIYIYRLIPSCPLVSLALPLARFFVIPSCPSLFLSRSELFVPIPGSGFGRVLTRFLLIRVFSCSPSPSRWSRGQLGFVESCFFQLPNLCFPGFPKPIPKSNALKYAKGYFHLAPKP